MAGAVQPGPWAGAPSGTAGSRWTGLLLWLPLALGVWLTFGHTVDDAFITLRYARNLLAGAGPAFNPGDRVEGFSSPLHLALVTGLEAIPHGHSLLGAKLASLVFVVLVGWRAQRLLGLLPVSAVARSAGLALVGCSYPLAMAGSNGLETSAYALVLLLVLEAQVTGRSEARPWATGLVGALVALARPEGIALILALALVSVRVRSGPAWAAIRWASVPLGASVLVTMGRLAYYGEPLPNTYLAKQVPVLAGARSGLGYLAWSVVPDSAYVPTSVGAVLGDVVLLGAMALAVLGAVAAWQIRRWSGAVALVATQAAVVLAVGGDWMRGSRFVVPVVVPAALLVALGVERVRSHAQQAPPPARRGIDVLVAAVVVGMVVIPWSRLPLLPVTRLSGADDASLVADGGYDATWAVLPELLDCVEPTDTVATTEIGYVGWARPDVRVMDLSGLTDRAIARGVPRSEKWTIGVGEPDWSDSTSFVVSEVLRREPEVVVVSSLPSPGSAMERRYRATEAIEVDGWTMTALVRRDRACAPGG